MESDTNPITIKIKTLDNSMFDLKIPKELTIIQLKTKIEKVSFFYFQTIYLKRK